VAIGTRDTVLFLRGYGHQTWSPSSPAMDPDQTLFDLASLTKVVATTPAVMVLVDEGRLHLNDPVQRYLPGFVGEGKESVTITDLLGHRSGLRAFLPLNTLTTTAVEARARVLAEPLRWRPGARVVYSDLNAMLLGWVVEEVTGDALDVFAARRVFAPLQMTHTRFRLPRAERSRAAPINVWHGHPIQGVIHDQNAERLGGVSGHAGLYSTAADLSRYAQMYLANGRGPDGRPFVGAATLARFLRRGPGNRALGWEANDTTTTTGSAGTLLSPAAVGHGGYTGTSIWIDPDRDLFVILLTNRVYHPRTRGSIGKLRRVRGDLADAAVRLRRHTCDTLRRYGAGGRIAC